MEENPNPQTNKQTEVPLPENLDLAHLIRITQHWPCGLNILLYEIVLWWEFVRYDLSATMFPGLTFAVAAWRATSAHLTPPGFLATVGRGLVYMMLYTYVFDLSNQLTGIQEDKIGKPDRPLVRGLCSPRGAFLRWIIASLIFLLLGWIWEVLLWTVIWILLSIWHNFTGAKHWLGKNLTNGLGVIAQLAALWQLSAPLTTRAGIWIITIATAVFVVIPLQDLRDMAGDELNGRHTFPLVYGEAWTRKYLALSFMLLPIVIFLVLIAPYGITWIGISCGVFLALLNGLTAWRVFFLRSPSHDHYTYLCFAYWYTFMAVTALLLF